MNLNPYYSFIPGDTNFPTELYKSVAFNCTNDDIICETGCSFGRNVQFLMEFLKLTGKKPKLYAFDTFGENFPSEFFEGYPEKTPWGEPFKNWTDRIGGPTRLIDYFAFYLKNSPARDYLTDYAQFPNWTVAEEFLDDSVSFVLSNGSHQPKNIKRELDKWWPKLKKHGKIALYGHNKDDFNTKLETARQFFSDNNGYKLDVGANYVIIVHP